MAWVDLPQYIKRDLRRLYGNVENVQALEINLLLAFIDGALRERRPPVVDGWILRHATQSAKTRHAIEVIEAVRVVRGVYQRRGDCVIFIPKPS